ncbi:MAG TPA: metallophosphoesterase [Actinomycetota bacterium]
MHKSWKAIVGVAVFVGILGGAGVRAEHDVPVLPDVFPKIRAILSPLHSQPAIVTDGSTLRVELDPELAGSSTDVEVTAELLASFGQARAPISLTPTGSETGAPSRLWPGRTVHALSFSVPAFGGAFVEDLYDLSVSYGSETDTQHRAVKVIDEYPEDFTFVILADPSVGDPRPVQEGAEDLLATGSPDSLLDKTMKTIGNPMDEDRWAALGRAIEEINLLQPDFVLVAGDLTFAIYPRPFNVEYEDAYRILSRLKVPAYMSPGNHDLYDFDYDDTDRPHTTDGKELWPLYFGPLYYSIDVGSNMHLIGLNTFDWEDHQREPFDEDDEFSTRAGGQIDDEQFAWLVDDLDAYRARAPEGQIVTFAHHDPSWIRARHPWPGKNRLETRDLLADLDVGVHFAGHTHEDRVARYHEGNVVETNGRRGPHGDLHYLHRDDTLDDSWSQEVLGAIIHEPSHGPAFVTTTTVSSVLKGPDWGQGSYWGYRFGVLDEQAAGGYDPQDFGYPATREFLDAHAERPERWSETQAEYGVFSYPSYFIDASSYAGTDDDEPYGFVYMVTNELLVDITVEVVLSIDADDAVVDGGTVLWTRTVDGITDVKVQLAVPSGGNASATVRAA